MFKKLYPDEATLQVSGIKNQSGFDICFDYKLGDLFDDNACLNVIESGSRFVHFSLFTYLHYLLTLKQAT